MSTTTMQPTIEATHLNPVSCPTTGDVHGEQRPRDVAWAAVGKVAAKEVAHDDLRSGGRHIVNLTLTGDVDGRRIAEQISGVLLIGHDQQRATSATPDQPRLVAAILAKLNRATREKVLRVLPEEFAAAGSQLPETDSLLVEAADKMLQRLRAKKTVTVRGSVRCEYCLGDLESVAS